MYFQNRTIFSKQMQMFIYASVQLSSVYKLSNYTWYLTNKCFAEFYINNDNNNNNNTAFIQRHEVQRYITEALESNIKQTYSNSTITRMISVTYPSSLESFLICSEKHITDTLHELK